MATKETQIPEVLQAEELAVALLEQLNKALSNKNSNLAAVIWLHIADLANFIKKHDTEEN